MKPNTLKQIFYCLLNPLAQIRVNAGSPRIRSVWCMLFITLGFNHITFRLIQSPCSTVVGIYNLFIQFEQKLYSAPILFQMIYNYNLNIINARNSLKVMIVKKTFALKLTIIICFLIVSFSQESANQDIREPVYTTQKAQQCFYSKALPTCQEKIESCMRIQACQRQVVLYQDCNFEKEFQNQIFNGNCFKNWKESAILTKQLFECLDSNCNLSNYNSQISLQVLYSCSTQALVDHHTQCDQNCQEALKRVISKKVPYQPIKEIYESNPQIKNQLANENAEKIIQIIKKECINQHGTIREKHEEIAREKMRQKMRKYQGMNEQLKNKVHEEQL